MLEYPRLSDLLIYVNAELQPVSFGRASQKLQSTEVIGLDVEWKPNTSGAQNPASLLQVLIKAHECKEGMTCILVHPVTTKNLVLYPALHLNASSAAVKAIVDISAFM